MIYEKMIETENSDPMRHAWSGYRQTLTTFIIDGIENFFCRRHLADHGKLRDQDFSLEKYLSSGHKPLVAVWGAGRCNDIDLHMLASYADLVLIDRDLASVRAARDRYHLSERQCSCMDLGFWEIFDEEERFFETLMPDADDLHLSEYLRQLQTSVNAQEPEYQNYADAFDFSVVCGVASQLNARFAGLLQHYGKSLSDVPRTAEMLRNMNRKSAQCLLDAVSITTKNAVFTANEMIAAHPDQEGVLAAYADVWTEEWEQWMMQESSLQSLPSVMRQMTCQVAGSLEFEQEIETARKKGELDIRHRVGMIWPFTDEKHYFMDVLAADFVNKKTK